MISNATVLTLLAAAGGAAYLTAWHSRTAAMLRLCLAVLDESEALLRAESAELMLSQTCQHLVRRRIVGSALIAQISGSGLDVVAAAGRETDAPPSPEDTALVMRAWNSRSCAHGRRTVVIPVRRRGEIWGALMLRSTTFGRRPSATVVEIAQGIAKVLGDGLDELQRKQQLQIAMESEATLARHDPLTGLPNRLAFEQRLAETLARTMRRGVVTALCLLDLDDFKLINDGFGHDAGDCVLREFAARLRDRVRDGDFVGRLGGDEFVVLIEDIDEVRAMPQIALALERLHLAVEAPMEFADQARGEVGMSLGLALFPLDATDGKSLLRRADQALAHAKAHKFERVDWWHRGEPEATEVPSHALDPYGVEAASLLRLATEQLEAAATRLAAAPVMSGEAPWNNLGPEATRHFLERWANHLRFVTDPGVSLDMIVRRSTRLGRDHILAGVDAVHMAHSHSAFRTRLDALIVAAPLLSRARQRLMQVVDCRLEDDLDAELRAADALRTRYWALLSLPLPEAEMPWADCLSRELAALQNLPGIDACEIFRPCAATGFIVEATAGTGPTRALNLINSTWHSGRIACATVSGSGSVLVVPVADPMSGDGLLLAVRGAHVNQFASAWITQFANGLQLRWNMIWRDHAKASGLGTSVLADLRWRVDDRGLEMRLQPIIDLSDGRPREVEALARLRLSDGSLAGPGSFLPRLGEKDLARMFLLGLERMLQTLGDWDSRGLKLDACLNLHSATLLDADCPRWIEDALRRHGVAPRRLGLDLTRTDLRHAEAIGGLARLGVRLQIDDFGIGEDSLRRLSSLPCDAIKLDQDLLARARPAPLQLVGVLDAVIQIGGVSGRPVIAEGLEDMGLIEAATILGASRGQGFGLARPMPAEGIPAWLESFKSPFRGGTIVTFLGALAYHWRFTRYGASGSAGACPLAAFLESQTEASAAAQRWHDATHAGDTTAARRLADWLEAGAREEWHGNAPNLPRPPRAAECSA